MTTQERALKMKRLHISYYKFFLLLIMLIAICLLKEDSAFMRTLLYIIAGIVLTAKSRNEKVTGIVYFSLIALLYIDLSIFIPILMPVRSFINIILNISGLYGILFFLTGTLIGYIIIPSSKSEGVIHGSEDSF